MSQIVTGPSFNTMLVWYLSGDMGQLSTWVAREMKAQGKKVTTEEFISIVNYIMTDFEMRVEKFAQEEGMTLAEMYEVLKKEFEAQQLLNDLKGDNSNG